MWIINMLNLQWAKYGHSLAPFLGTYQNYDICPHHPPSLHLPSDTPIYGSCLRYPTMCIPVIPCTFVCVQHCWQNIINQQSTCYKHNPETLTLFSPISPQLIFLFMFLFQYVTALALHGSSLEICMKSTGAGTTNHSTQWGQGGVASPPDVNKLQYRPQRPLAIVGEATTMLLLQPLHLAQTSWTAEYKSFW